MAISNSIRIECNKCHREAPFKRTSRGDKVYDTQKPCGCGGEWEVARANLSMPNETMGVAVRDGKSYVQATDSVMRLAKLGLEKIDSDKEALKAERRERDKVEKRVRRIGDVNSTIETIEKLIDSLRLSSNDFFTLEKFYSHATIAKLSDALGNSPLVGADVRKTYHDLAVKHAKVITEFFFDFRQNNSSERYSFLVEQLKEQYEMGNKDSIKDTIRDCFDIRARDFDVDSYFIALEWNREEDDKFYLPRRDCFMNMQTVDGEKFSMIQDAQDYIDGKLDFLFTSMPQRTGKSTLGIFLHTLLIQKDLEKSIFGIGHSAGLAQHFYNQVLNVMNDKVTYRYFEIFKKHRVAKTNADNYTIDIDRGHAFPNFTFRSIDGNITGSTEASLAAYADDLIKGVEEVSNPEVADKIWGKVNTLILGRMKKNVRLYGTATLWGDNCPFTRLINEMYKLCDDGLYDIDRIRVRKLAWCNSEGESQFNYKFNLGFDTKHFKRLEKTMVLADYPLWCAMYLSTPISRYGRPLQNIKYYDCLPTNEDGETIEPDYYAMSIDTALGSGDYYSAPIGAVYEKRKEVYFVDVIYDKRSTDITLPRTIEKIIEYNVCTCAVEEKEPNPKNARIRFGIGEKIYELLLRKGYRCNIESKSAAGETSKRARILSAKSEIIALDTQGLGYKFYYLSPERRKGNVDYELFVQNILMWSEETSAQKKQQDGAPDSLAQFAFRILKLKRNSGKFNSMKLGFLP